MTIVLDLAPAELPVYERLPGLGGFGSGRVGFSGTRRTLLLLIPPAPDLCTLRRKMVLRDRGLRGFVFSISCRVVAEGWVESVSRGRSLLCTSEGVPVNGPAVVVAAGELELVAAF